MAMAAAMANTEVLRVPATAQSNPRKLLPVTISQRAPLSRWRPSLFHLHLRVSPRGCCPLMLSEWPQACSDSRPTCSRLVRLLGRTGRMTPSPSMGPQNACQTCPHTLQNRRASCFSQESHQPLYRGICYSRHARLPTLPSFLDFLMMPRAAVLAASLCLEPPVCLDGRTHLRGLLGHHGRDQACGVEVFQNPGPSQGAALPQKVLLSPR